MLWQHCATMLNCSMYLCVFDSLWASWKEPNPCKYVHKLTKTLTTFWLVSLPYLNPFIFWITVVSGISVWAGSLEVLESGVAVVTLLGLWGLMFEEVDQTLGRCYLDIFFRRWIISSSCKWERSIWLVT